MDTPIVDEDSRFPQSKICKGCQIDKPLSAFGVQKLGKYGHRSRCNECRKQYRLENRDVILAGKRKHYQKNAVRLRAETAQWKRNNPDKVKAQQQRKFERNPNAFRDASNRR